MSFPFANFATMTSFGPPPGFTPPYSSSSSSSGSSSTSDDDGESPLFSSEHPWAYVLIPVTLLTALGLLAALLHNLRSRRRRNSQPSSTLSYNPMSSPHLRPTPTRRRRDILVSHRDLESGDVHRTPDWVPQPSRTWWAMGTVRTQEEGLNELGEAPPPYDDSTKKKPAKEEETEYEMAELAGESSGQSSHQAPKASFESVDLAFHTPSQEQHQERPRIGNASKPPSYDHGQESAESSSGRTSPAPYPYRPDENNDHVHEIELPPPVATQYPERQRSDDQQQPDGKGI
ncbi:hypothetical protein QBC35DRAFT_486597 [Podospora australis]|uniref:Uncharacterized protein n=1 Tax=Podospora australis TaxID=1536484 RepID=A0AAN6X1I4_9PEZI|nr:hypothetical protein QBC35DRAFT_486597 [Podospora australis]